MSDYSLDRGMPASADTERVILGGIILDDRNPNECYLQAATRLEAEDFLLDSHRRIFRRMQDLIQAGKPIDYVTLTAELEQHKELEAVGGTAYVTSLAEGMFRVKNLDCYCDIILQHSSQRKIIYTASAAIQRAYELEDAEEVIGTLSEGLRAIEERAQGDALLPVSKIVPVVASELLAEFDRNAEFIGLPTGIGYLDYLLGGLVAGENIVVAADKGGGKSAFALGVAEYNCLRDTPVGIFSLEMSRSAYLRRLAAKRAGVPPWKLRLTQRLTFEERHAILRELGEIAKWPMWIDDTAGPSPAQLYSRGRMLASKGAKLLIVDYLQKIRAAGRDLRHQMNNASEAVRSMAKDSKAAVLNLSQFSRPADKGHKSLQYKPTMHDLMESGAIEADANAVILLWKDWQQTDDGGVIQTGKDLIIVGKNREGLTNKEIPATFDGPLMQWRARETAESVPDFRAASAGE